MEQELGILFPKQGNKRTEFGTQMKKSDGDTRFRMLVEDVREGVLVSMIVKFQHVVFSLIELMLNVCW